MLERLPDWERALLLVLASSDNEPLRRGSSPATAPVVAPVLESVALFGLDRERDLAVGVAAAPAGLATHDTISTPISS